MSDKNNLQKGFSLVAIAVIAVLIILAVGGGYFGYIKFQEYRVKQIEKEKRIQELLEAQQKSLEEAQKEIEGLKTQPQDTQLSQPDTKNNVTGLTNAQIIQKIKPAVVYVETGYGAGSGMIIEKDGHILTNAHVIKGTASVKIYLSNDQSFLVEKISVNEDLDLALLKINTDNLPTVELGDSNKAQQGDEVFTFGYPFGIKGDVSFKEGTISRKLSEEGVDYIEISAEFHPGNSGGPLVDRYGKVIGINTAKFGRKSVKGVLLGESIKLAIPINVANNLIPTLKSSEKFVSSFTSDCSLQKAKGFITVYSEWDPSMKIIATTRFVSPQGLIFRTDEDILVPAFGKITVSVTANKTGSEYKIGPSTFSIPGFAGTPRYTAFYGKSFQSMSCD